MKSVLYIFVGLLISSGVLAQSNADQLIQELLNQSEDEIAQYSYTVNLDRAIKVLDTQKDKGEIDETTFQKNLGVLMSAKKVNSDKMIADRRKQAEIARAQNPKDQAKGGNMYDLMIIRLKDKLDAGKITQVEYDARLEELKSKKEKYEKQKINH